MKFVRIREKPSGLRWFVFHLGKQEVECLEAALGFYPLLEIVYQPLSRSGSVGRDKQELLDDITRDRRTVRKKEILEFLSNSKNIRWDAPGTYRLALTMEQADWLLSVLNEIRVGCWNYLGCPELNKLNEREMDDEQCRERAIMDLCGYFEMGFLEPFKLA